jgi:hypothetical protein
MISLALHMTNSSVAASEEIGASAGCNSMYSLVMFRSLGMHKIDPEVSELITALLHRSGKSVSITPSKLVNYMFLARILQRYLPSSTPHADFEV